MVYIWFRVPPPISHIFCTRHCSETHIFNVHFPPAGFGGSIARNCGEMQILSSRNCPAQCTGHFNPQQMESYTYIHPCTYIFINIIYRICKNIYVYLHIHICISISLYTYTYRYISIRINIYIHTSSTATTTTTTHTTGGGGTIQIHYHITTTTTTSTTTTTTTTTPPLPTPQGGGDHGGGGH